MKKLILILFILLTAGETYAQTAYSEQYRRKALEYNHDLKAAEKNISASLELIRSAQGDRLPQISAGGSWQYTINPVEINANLPSVGSLTLGGENHHQYGLSTSVAQPLYTGGRILQSIRLAKFQASAARNQADLLRSAINYQADILYWNIVARSEMVGINERYRFSVEELVKIVKQRVDVGLIDPQELLMAEVKLDEAQLRYLESNNLLQTGMMALNSLIGNNLSTILPIDSSIVVSPLASPSASILDRPEMRLAQDQIHLAETREKLVKAGYNPRLSVGVDGSYSSPGYDFKKGADWNGAVYAQLTIPVWSGGKRRSDSRAARQRLYAANDNYRKVEDQVNLEIQTAEANFSQACKRILLTDNSLSKAVENENKSTERYKEGQTSILEVIDAQIYTLNARNACVRARLDAQNARAEYIRATAGYNLME